MKDSQLRIKHRSLKFFRVLASQGPWSFVENIQYKYLLIVTTSKDTNNCEDMYNMSLGGCDECGGLCGEVCEYQVVENPNKNATNAEDKINQMMQLMQQHLEKQKQDYDRMQQKQKQDYDRLISGLQQKLILL